MTMKILMNSSEEGLQVNLEEDPMDHTGKTTKIRPCSGVHLEKMPLKVTAKKVLILPLVPA